MKTVGIIADNYKVEKFIKVKVEEKEINEVHKICKLLEMHFKQSN